MKAGNDTEYEVDLIAEMESRPDPDFANAEKVPVLGPADAEGARKVKRRKLVRKFEKRNIHVFTVAGCRVWALNGQVCIMQSADTYVKGMCDVVGKFCDPYFSFLKSGEEVAGNALNVVRADSQTVFATGNGDGKAYAAKMKVLESFKTTMDMLFSGRDVLTKQRRAFAGEVISNGIRSAKEFAAQALPDLEFQYMHLRRFEDRLKQEGMPDGPSDKLKSMLDLALLEAKDEWANFHTPPPVASNIEGQDVSAGEGPF
jgi:hypothetical protein